MTKLGGLMIEIRATEGGEIVDVVDLPDPRLKFIERFNELQAKVGSGLKAIAVAPGPSAGFVRHLACFMFVAFGVELGGLY